MCKKQRKVEELQSASNHLYYEWWMLRSTASAMASGIAQQGWLINALLESFVIHVRGLMDFFYCEKPRTDDVVATDFFLSPSEWEQIRPSRSEILRRAKKRADKEIAHLTYARLAVTPENKPWEFIPITEDIHKLMEVFLAHVAPEKLGADWPSNEEA